MVDVGLFLVRGGRAKVVGKAKAMVLVLAAGGRSHRPHGSQNRAAVK